MISLQVFYEGNVQGVGFRWTIRQIAKGFDVIGWVQNLPDGRVELQVGGEESEVFAFLDSVMESEVRSHIDKQTRSLLPEVQRLCQARRPSLSRRPGRLARAQIE